MIWEVTENLSEGSNNFLNGEELKDVFELLILLTSRELDRHLAAILYDAKGVSPVLSP